MRDKAEMVFSAVISYTPYSYFCSHGHVVYAA